MSQSESIKRVGLRVRDLETMLAYYRQLGLALVRDERAAGTVGLGAGGVELLTLRHTPDALPRAPHTAGLYHFALLLPGESDLGALLRHCLHAEGPRLDRMEDHLVAQSLYLYDPEGNGIEVSADSPREQWEYRDGRPVMGLSPLSAEAQQTLLAQARDFSGMPDGTVLGHMHLNVSDLKESTTYYQQMFGLEVVFDISEQGASFLSWEDYHHRLGLNTWNGPDAAHHDLEVSGIDFFEIARPGVQPGTYQDPDGVVVRVTANE